MTREFIPAPKGFVIERTIADGNSDIVSYRFSIAMTLDVAISMSADSNLDYRTQTLEYGVRQLARGASDKLAEFAR